jgi:hypothetical protein
MTEVAEPVGAPDRIRVGIRQADTVSPSELEHQIGLERPLDVQVQLGFGQRQRIDHLPKLLPQSGRNWTLIRAPRQPATFGMPCSQVRWQLPPITSRSP